MTGSLGDRDGATQLRPGAIGPGPALPAEVPQRHLAVQQRVQRPQGGVGPGGGAVGAARPPGTGRGGGLVACPVLPWGIRGGGVGVHFEVEA